MLNQLNRLERIQPVDTYEPTIETDPRPTQPPHPISLMPKLGEILPIKPEPIAQTRVTIEHQIQIPATGRVLDLYM